MEPSRCASEAQVGCCTPDLRGMVSPVPRNGSHHETTCDARRGRAALEGPPQRLARAPPSLPTPGSAGVCLSGLLPRDVWRNLASSSSKTPHPLTQRATSVPQLCTQIYFFPVAYRLVFRQSALVRVCAKFEVQDQSCGPDTVTVCKEEKDKS